jgi:hypothetical protein
MRSTEKLVSESARSRIHGVIRAFALGSLVGIAACGPGSEAREKQ